MKAKRLSLVAHLENESQHSQHIAVKASIYLPFSYKCNAAKTGTRQIGQILYEQTKQNSQHLTTNGYGSLCCMFYYNPLFSPHSIPSISLSTVLAVIFCHQYTQDSTFHLCTKASIQPRICQVPTAYSPLKNYYSLVLIFRCRMSLLKLQN